MRGYGRSRGRFVKLGIAESVFVNGELSTDGKARISIVLWSAIKGVLDVASMPFGRRRGHVPWSVADVVSFVCCPGQPVAKNRGLAPG